MVYNADDKTWSVPVFEEPFYASATVRTVLETFCSRAVRPCVRA